MSAADRSFRSRDDERGFTLIEMLVALAVFSLAALALIRLQAVAVRTTADLSGRAGAQVVAENLRVELLTDGTPPAMGSTQAEADNGGRHFAWVRVVRPTPIPTSKAITLTVEEQGGTGQRAVLSFLRTER